MHELSLAQSLIEMVAGNAQERSIRHVRTVTVRIGKWSAVLPESLSASFEILASLEGEMFEDAKLVIHREPVRAFCTACDEHFEVGDGGLICPACRGPARLERGVELEIESYEGE